MISEILMVFGIKPQAETCCQARGMVSINLHWFKISLKIILYAFPALFGDN